ncbi:hypothetical protein GCM10029963_27830 [Micromonospora andamanensis]|uniref:BtrH N-terminal domain-containing protein n=1 Tax=Micromonospora andamanensis TaxID=1287068 RepID=UPI001951201F|nr:BtrH N-terminal domain-containing protein [Micromonospora andamanensis]GIJ38578.1 hypothetical protein Vwe01_19030 [Micromonospora andamanensis]
MTSDKHLKARIRARMAKTGERYAEARRHIVGISREHTDHGYALRGGIHPETANIANVLHHHGREISEAMVLGVGGGLGAGYILWELAAHDSAVLTLGFRHRWNYLDWTDATLTRLGVPFRVERTGGARKAQAALTAALDAGHPAIVVPDRLLVGYWHLPAHLDGYGGHQVVAYAHTGGGIRLDDRNLGPLTVDSARLDRARARVGSYRNCLWEIEGPGGTDLGAAVLAGLGDCLAGLGGSSTSFALPAWRKWARSTADARAAKGWPTVFAGGTGLVGALLSIWEGVEPVGATGGHLRDLYARFLDEAAVLLRAPDLTACGDRFRETAAAWHAVAEAALPADVPDYRQLRELSADLAAAVTLGDEGDGERSTSAAALWAARAELDRRPPVDPDFPALATAIETAYEIESVAVNQLRKAVRSLAT